MMLDFKGFRDTIKGVRNNLQGLADEIEALRRRRETMEDAPLPVDDFADMILESIDVAGQGYGASISHTLAGFIPTPPARIMEMGPRLAGNLLQAGTAIGGAVGYPPDRGGLSLQSLWFLFGDTLRPKLREAIMNMEGYPDGVGLPRAERAVEIAKLDTKIDQLEKREAKLVAEVEAAGIRMAE